MIQFFQHIGDLINIVVNFVVQAFTNLINLISFVISAVGVLPTVLAVLPATIYVPVAAFTFYMVVRTIINKGDN